MPRSTCRRCTVLWLLLTLAAAPRLPAQNATVAASPESSDPAIRVTLLGTGRPDPAIDRFGPSTLIVAGGETLIVDCGRGEGLPASAAE